MARITKAIVARNERIQKYIATLDADLAEALGHFAAEFGNDWPTVLIDHYYTGRDANFHAYIDGKRTPFGHYLRQIRNHPVWGPAFYTAYHGQ